MFKRFLLTILFFFTASIVFGQIGSARTRIVLNFKEQQSLLVSHPSVDLNLDKVDVYSNGAETGNLKSHLIVNCSTPYELSVKTINSYFQYELSLSSLPVSIINLKPSISKSTSVDSPLKLNTISLTSTAQVILQSENRGNSQQIDVNYIIPKQNVSSLLNKKPGKYQTEIIYTLLAH